MALSGWLSACAQEHAPKQIVLRGADGPVSLSAWAQSLGKPRFESFQVSESLTAPASAVQFASNRGARAYRTVLTEASKTGPNFAGHYTVAYWGCGSPCGRFAIIDAQTGKVFMSDVSAAIPPLVRRNSRLLIVDATSSGRADTIGHPMLPYIFYYEWVDDTLVLRDSLNAEDIVLK